MTRAQHRPATTRRRLTVWRFADGKPGHDNQSRGLLAALAERVALDSHELKPLAHGPAFASLLRGRYPDARHLPTPDLIVGAGHRTHWSMLAARRARGGRVIVLMRPSLPLSWFDLCIIPDHDQPPQRRNVIATVGALNRIRPAADKDPASGMILIGGPSRHYGWDQSDLLEQVRAVLERRHLNWIIATSRRTPAATEQALAPLAAAGIRMVPARQTDPDWLPERLRSASEVWITADSVSMVYEALTAGAACGLLNVPATGRGRVATGMDQLAAKGMLTNYEQWRQGAPMQPPPPFNEAERCARWIEREWLQAQFDRDSDAPCLKRGGAELGACAGAARWKFGLLAAMRVLLVAKPWRGGLSHYMCLRVG